MKKIVLTAMLVLILSSSTFGAVGFEPEHLESHPWVFTVVEISVYASSPFDYTFDHTTRVYFEPFLSAFVIWRQIKSESKVNVIAFVSPRWLFSKNQTTLWLLTDDKALGLPMEIK